MLIEEIGQNANWLSTIRELNCLKYIDGPYIISYKAAKKYKQTFMKGHTNV